MTRLLLSPLLSLTKPQAPLKSLLQNLIGDHGRSVNQISKVRHHHVGLSSYKNTSCGFKTFCTDRDLSIKKCVPCNSNDLLAMTEQNALELLPKVAGWKLVNEDSTLKLQVSWKVKSFTKGLDLFKLVADVAEAEGHHPDLHLVGWNNVKIDIWTHAVGGLTENDFILAAKINQLELHHLLRTKIAKNQS